MPAIQAEHPGVEQLSGFALGKLEPDQIDVIESHLSGCAPCCETLKQFRQDTFVDLVRELGRPPAQDAHGATLTLATASTEVDNGNRLFEVPAELANHPRYRVQELLGTGGMGAVYRAEHRLMQRAVALKIINPRLVASESAVERFRREIQAAARLQHQNIVTAFDADQAGDVHFFVMEYVKGINLQSLLEQRGPLSVTEACEYVRQAAIGLQHAHETGMVHRDIKPHNLVVMSGTSQVKILDFGLASLASVEVPPSEASPSDDVDAELTHAGTLMGTPDYMAPEQGRDAHAADIRADIYSLGCTLYTLLSGKVPFPGGTALEKVKAHAERTPQPIAELRRDLPSGLAHVLHRMMAKEPAQRFQTPAAVAAALAPFAMPTVRRRSRRRNVVLALAATAAVILFGIIYVKTDKGTLTIDSAVDDIQVVVTKGGNEVEVIDLKSGTTVKRLPSGEYSVRLKGDRTDVQLSKDGLKITRGSQEIVVVKEVARIESVAKTTKPRRKLAPTDEIAPNHRKAIDRGLEFLVRTQSKEGYWAAHGGSYRISMTALAAMALLMEGSTVDSGPYAESIRKAVDWLMTLSQPNGLLSDPKEPSEAGRYFFGHGYSMMFLASVYSQLAEGEQRAQLKEILTRAVEFTANGTTTRGGWGYVAAKDGGDFDESATSIVQLQALRAARNAGIVVPRRLLDAEFLRKCTSPTGGVLYSIAQPDGERPSVTAAALSAGDLDSDLTKKWVKACQRLLSINNTRQVGFDDFTHYYYAQGIYQLGEKGYEKLFPTSKPEERLQWSKYRAVRFDDIVKRQSVDGSWPETTIGPVYGTACNLTILQLDNAAVPIYQR